MSNHRLSRRGLLKSAAFVSGATFVSPFVSSVAFAQAAAATKRRFIFFYFPGGWDHMLFLDPREAELNMSQSAYQAEVARTSIDTSYIYGPGSLDGLDVGGNYFKAALYKPAGSVSPQFAFGPGVVPYDSSLNVLPKPNLAKLAETVPMSIVRGINMGTLGHEPGYVYFLTGEPAIGLIGRGSSMPIRVAAQLGANNGLGDVVTPVVALGIDSYTGTKPGKYGAFSLQAISDATRIIKRPTELYESAAAEGALDKFQKFNPASAGVRLQLADSHARTQQVIASNLASKLEFLTGTDADSQAVRDRYGLSPTDDPLSPGPVAAFVAQSIKYGFSQFISATLPYGMDTHGTSNRGHLPRLYPDIEAVARLVDDLASTPATDGLSGSWMDNTTILCFSEFTRTPLHNPANGRDHHFVNSCLMMGAGIQKGAVVGATTSVGGMVPVYFDFMNQQLLGETATPSNEFQRYIQPEDIGVTLMASAGLDYSEYRNGRPLWGAITQTPYVP
jgi:hypothetical protein